MNLAKLRLQFSKELHPPQAAQVRGAVGNLYPNTPLLHHHQGDQLLYLYPRVQFKTEKGAAIILGIEEGCALVTELNESLEQLQVGEEALRITSRNLSVQNSQFAPTDVPVGYTFATPWFALNKKNFQRYKRSTLQQRQDLLNRILVGNVLSMAKGLGTVVNARLEADVHVREKPVRFKGNQMLCFRGRFRINCAMPDYVGIGKSVSRGFGTILRDQ
jgi:hypothetical protein